MVEKIPTLSHLSRQLFMGTSGLSTIPSTPLGNTQFTCMGRAAADLSPGQGGSIWRKGREAKTCPPVTDTCFLCLWLDTSWASHPCE